jgi:hypothetical protein
MDSRSPIPHLTDRLAASRSALHDSIEQIEDQLNVPKRIRQEVADHPLKWLALAAGVGYAGLRVVPLVLKLTRKTWISALLTPVVKTAAAAALPLAAETLSRALARREAPVPPPVPDPRLP